jgi:hypothetical protein
VLGQVTEVRFDHCDHPVERRARLTRRSPDAVEQGSEAGLQHGVVKASLRPEVIRDRSEIHVRGRRDHPYRSTVEAVAREDVAGGLHECGPGGGPGVGRRLPQ